MAETRNLTGASLNLRMHAAGDPYYNVYRYAFFGKVPEINEGDPALRAREAKAAGKRLFASKRSPIVSEDSHREQSTRERVGKTEKPMATTDKPTGPGRPTKADLWKCEDLKQLIRTEIRAHVKDVELAKKLEQALGDKVAYGDGGGGNVAVS